MIDILYFAWLRERIGTNRERVETAAATVSDLVAELMPIPNRKSETGWIICTLASTGLCSDSQVV